MRSLVYSPLTLMFRGYKPIKLTKRCYLGVTSQLAPNSKTLPLYTGPIGKSGGASINRWPAFIVADNSFPVETSCACRCAVLDIANPEEHYLAHLKPPGDDTDDWNSNVLAQNIASFLPLSRQTKVRILAGASAYSEVTVNEILKGLYQLWKPLRKAAQFVHYPRHLARHVLSTSHRFQSFCEQNDLCCQVSIVSYQGDVYYRKRKNKNDLFNPLTFSLLMNPNDAVGLFPIQAQTVAQAKQREVETYTYND